MAAGDAGTIIRSTNGGSSWTATTSSTSSPLYAVAWANSTALAVGLSGTIVRSTNIPIIASGGAGGPEHIREALDEGEADAALAASIFHYGEYTVGKVKSYLRKKGVNVR